MRGGGCGYVRRPTAGAGDGGCPVIGAEDSRQVPSPGAVRSACGGGPVNRPAELPLKFAVPVAAHVVARPRLHALLTAGTAGPVTVIAAAAGWGKTLLAASWVAAGAGGRAAAWVSLDEGDDDARRFWPTLATAPLPVIGPKATAALRRVIADEATDADGLPGLLAAAVRLAERPVVLVLDNLHEV